MKNFSSELRKFKEKRKFNQNSPINKSSINCGIVYSYSKINSNKCVNSLENSPMTVKLIRWFLVGEFWKSTRQRYTCNKMKIEFSIHIICG